MSCPLCDNEGYRASWLGKTFYNEREFEYVECLSCRSLYCQPMPDAETLAKMYGSNYYGEGAELQENFIYDPPQRLEKITKWLGENEPQLFFDYGCGNGSLLQDAVKAGWRSVGLEFDPQVAEQVEKRSGVRVVTEIEQLGENFQADVLHVGDVIEHLTDLNRQMPQILNLIKPNGILLAQGPLEANGNLFTFLVKTSRRLRGASRAEMPPFHVLLATATGQKRFFERFDLQEISFQIEEDSHPASASIEVSDILRPKKFGLFVVRRLSQTASALNPRSWGNRYFYVGRRSGTMNSNS